MQFVYIVIFFYLSNFIHIIVPAQYYYRTKEFRLYTELLILFNYSLPVYVEHWIPRADLLKMYIIKNIIQEYLEIVLHKSDQEGQHFRMLLGMVWTFFKHSQNISINKQMK